MHDGPASRKTDSPCPSISSRVYLKNNIHGKGGLSMTKAQHGIIACVIGAVTWGVNGVASQFLLSNYPVEPSWVASIRMALAGLLLTFMVIPKKSHLIRQMLHDPISLRHLIIFAIFGLTLSQFSYLSAIKTPTPARQRSCRLSASSSCPST